MASAAVVLWVASLCPSVSPDHLAAVFAEGLFLEASQLEAGARVGLLSQPAAAGAAVTAAGAEQLGAVEAGLRARGSNLAREISRFSQVCVCERRPGSMLECVCMRIYI